VGVWGTPIFSDDLAADVRDMFTDLMGDGLSAAEATDTIVAEYTPKLDEPGDTGVMWMALAATQWKLGRLIDAVRDRAILVIDSGDDLQRWQDSPKSEIRQREKHLAKLREQLHTPQPPAKKIKKRVKASTDFVAGDVVRYRYNDTLWVRFVVLEIWGDRGGTYHNICLLGIDDNNPFKAQKISLESTLGPHFTMLSQEPADRVEILKRGVLLPAKDQKTYKAWNNITIKGHATWYKNFDDDLAKVLPQLGWTQPGDGLAGV
jgi:hypothetical protein